jgi:hypothetical protein
MPLWDESDDIVIRIIIGSAIGMRGYFAVAGSIIFMLCGLVLAVSVLFLLVRGIVGVFRK